MTKTAIKENRIRDISLILKDFLKVIKVVSIYPVDNPLPQSMKRSFAERLVSLVEQYGQIAISVQKDSLLFENEVVFQTRLKEENLAGVFFEAGITDFTFQDGLEIDDVYKLLEVVKDYNNSPQSSQDLAAQLWEAEINRFTFSTLEDISLSEYDGNFNLQEYMQAYSLGDPDKSQFATDQIENYQSIFNLEQETNEENLDDSSDIDIDSGGHIPTGPSERAQFYAIAQGEPSGTASEAEGIDSISLPSDGSSRGMDSGDIPAGAVSLTNTALILNEELKLSHEEEENVGSLVGGDAEFDLYESTTETLKEMLLQEVEMNGFYETVTICVRVLTEFLQAGKLIEATHILHFLRELEGKIRGDKPLWAERLKDACVTAGSRDRLKALSEGLNNHPDISGDEVEQYLDNFGWEALSGITDLLGELDHHLHSETLCRYLATKGRNHPDMVAKGIYDKRCSVVCNSIGILAQIGDDVSLNYLKHALKHDKREVRLELVTALKKCSNDKALELLSQAAMDSDREIRTEAVNSIVARRSSAAFETITTLINGEDFISWERGDQETLLTAFSMLGGEMAVGYLSRLILKYNPFRNPTLAFYRRAAFDALSYNRSEKGERLLVKLASSRRPDIRRQASIALHRRREIMFGGE